MQSLRELYRIGHGPSSSHTMAPRHAAERFLAEHGNAHAYRVTLYGSLAATGSGHLTDVVLLQAFAPATLTIEWNPGQELGPRPNGMLFEALGTDGQCLAQWRVFSVGGGALRGEDEPEPPSVYPHAGLSEILDCCDSEGLHFWEYVFQVEGEDLAAFLGDTWDAMRRAIERGLEAEGVLPGGLGLTRKAWALQRKARMSGARFRRTGLLAAYALAVAEENAAAGEVVTAPTCGAAGVLPSVIRFLDETVQTRRADVVRALATAGLIGNVVKANASIAGAEVGCQGEIGTACAMAAGAAAQLLGGSPRQIEYAAEMGLEHHLGLTCDPVAGLVQIPCIERNAMAATRAVTCADYALFSDGGHRVSFDDAVVTMKQTGHDLPSLYRETGSGGLAAAYRHAGRDGQRR
ncbi:MAG: serine dehydratase [Chitinivibrionales bacterium]|nr:serine dehydratase [Chitinivibrionales bacterium]